LHLSQPVVPCDLLVLNRSGLTPSTPCFYCVILQPVIQISDLLVLNRSGLTPSTPCFYCVILQVAQRAKKHARVDLHIKAGQIGIRGALGPAGYDGPKGFTGPRGNRVFCSVSHSRSFAQCHQHLYMSQTYCAGSVTPPMVTDEQCDIRICQ